MSAFELSKWYADCVSEKGHVSIVYHAELCLGGLRIHYESLLLKDRLALTCAVFVAAPPPSFR